MRKTNATNQTILLVDDDPDFLAQTRLVLEGRGYQILTAGGLTEAEQVIQRHQPDLAVVDLMMENVDDGFTLCYRLKKAYPEMPVIMVTAVASEASLEFDASTVEERSWLKADLLLDKPIRFEQLEREIRRLLAK